MSRWLFSFSLFLPSIDHNLKNNFDSYVTARQWHKSRTKAKNQKMCYILNVKLNANKTNHKQKMSKQKSNDSRECHRRQIDHGVNNAPCLFRRRQEHTRHTIHAIETFENCQLKIIFVYFGNMLKCLKLWKTIESCLRNEITVGCWHGPCHH